MTAGRPLLTILICCSCIVLLFSACSHMLKPTYEQEFDFALHSAKEGLWKETHFRFENLAKRNPNDPIVHNNLGVSLEALGDFQGAETEYQRALNLDPNNAVIRENYERLQQILKEKVKN